jgi:aryl-alcohol dehydrogenase-like predicted oxidoreductase
MRTRPFGATGLAVSELGLGAGPLGDPSVLDDAAAERLVHAALELGITLIDTAPSYGRSEQRIGHALRGRRDRVVLSTKLGYGVPGVPDWTGPCITAGIELALERLATTWLDIAHFHSCPLDVLQRSDILDALAAAQRSGKVRVAAYSGDNAPLLWAIESGLFGGVQCSVNVADQRALDRALPLAAARGLGVLAKRPLANGAWREPVRPDSPDRAAYWDRLHAMGISLTAERALGFVLAQPTSSILVGTTRIDHLRAMAETSTDPAADQLRELFRRHDRSWDGII